MASKAMSSSESSSAKPSTVYFLFSLLACLAWKAISSSSGTGSALAAFLVLSGLLLLLDCCWGWRICWF